MSDRTCLLCGRRDPGVSMGLVEYRDPPSPSQRWDSIPRCEDVVACRQRVEAENREPWPLVSKAVAQPMPTRPPAPADADPPVASETPSPLARPDWLGGPS